MASPHMLGNERKYLLEAMESNWIAPVGPFVDRIEDEIARFVTTNDDPEYSVATSTGTSALHLAVKELGIGRGDIVFCSSMTFAASVNPAVYEGAEPWFIDSETTTYNMSPDALLKAIKIKRPKAVIIPHIYGTPASSALFDICKQYCIPIIEDAAEVFGARYKDGAFAGTEGNYGAFSFNGNKIITGSNGGMLVTKDAKSAEHAKFLSTQAKENGRLYYHREIGFNYRMSNLSAAVLLGQFEKLRLKIEMKKNIYRMYEKEFQMFYGAHMLKIPDDRTSNYWLSVMVTDDPTERLVDRIIDNLEKENIESRHVWFPLHMEPVFRGSTFISDTENSRAYDFFKKAICLPSDTHMDTVTQMKIIRIIKRTISEFYKEASC